jgi:hypothetical protein
MAVVVPVSHAGLEGLRYLLVVEEVDGEAKFVLVISSDTRGKSTSWQRS